MAATLRMSRFWGIQRYIKKEKKENKMIAIGCATATRIICLDRL